MTIKENLETIIVDEYDVIVCGGGPAGCGAAIAAAREGAKTLLIEKNGYLGGGWTQCLINPFFDTENKDGLVKEFTDCLKKKNAFGGFANISFDYETMKYMLDTKTQEAGVTVLFHTYFSMPVMEGNTVKGVIVENKSGRQAFLSKIVIDCTGDGDVAYRAGAKFNMGREDGKTQAMTLMFLLGNIKYIQNGSHELYNLMKKAVDENDTGYEVSFDRPYIIQLPIGNYAVVQLTHVRNKNGTDAFDLSKAEVEGRKMVQDTFRLFKNYIPEFKDVDLVATAPAIGVRETRRIVGEYEITYLDLKNGTKFDDGITEVTFNVDVHDPDTITQSYWNVKPYQIPLRSLIPKGLEGILVAGRCISGDFQAHASYRVTGNCLAMGEAAGKYAAKRIL